MLTEADKLGNGESIVGIGFVLAYEKTA